MLQDTKNNLLLLLLAFEQSFIECQNDINKKTNDLAANGNYSAASVHSFIIDIIARNIQSIKKQINKI